jgi:hypothetical protein
MIHHADYAIPVTQRIRCETTADPDGNGPLRGRFISLGWWVDPGAETDPDHEPTGTLYLIADPSRARPYWVPQVDLASTTPLD